MYTSPRLVWTAWWIVAIGALHTLFGLLEYSSGWTAIANAGFWDAVEGEPPREHAFWFTLFGPFLVLLGALMRWIVHQPRLRLPAFLGWGLLLFAAVAALLIPVSGFWLFVPPGLAITRSKPALQD